MFKVVVRVPFEFNIAELLYVFGAASIHVAPNSWKIVQAVVWFYKWWRCSANRYFWRSWLSRKQPPWLNAGVEDKILLCLPDRWRERLLDVVDAEPKELEISQKMVLEFFRPHNFKWYALKEGLTFFRALVASAGAEVCRSGETSSSSASAGLRGTSVQREVSKEEEVSNEGKEEADFQVALPLSREEARCSGLVVASPETLVELVHSKPAKPIHPMLAEPSLGVGLASGPSERQRAVMEKGIQKSQQGHRRHNKIYLCVTRSWGRPLVSFRRRSKDAEDPQRPPWKLTDLEERIHLIDGCASRTEYCYHMLKESVPTTLGRPPVKDLFGASHIMNEEECRMVIIVRKCPEEVVVTQTTKEVM
ncbi:hypothetical protein ACLOJK_007108 [Asimina triloba]